MSRHTWEIRKESYAFRLRGYHPLWPIFPDCSSIHTICNSLPRLTPQLSAPTTPVIQHCQVLTYKPVWAIPVSLAATKGITIVFFSRGYLDVSVLRVRLAYLCIQYAMTRYKPGRVVPFGNLRLNGYLHLNEAYRSLSRPSSPSCAKASTVCPK